MSTKPPLSIGKVRTEATTQKLAKKKTTSSLPNAKHKGVYRSSSFSEQDEFKSVGDEISDSKLCKNTEARSSNSAIISRMEREIDVSLIVEVEFTCIATPHPTIRPGVARPQHEARALGSGAWSCIGFIVYCVPCRN